VRHSNKCFRSDTVTAESPNPTLTERLPAFGPYQDAMRGDGWAMARALVSGAMNLCLSHSMEVIEEVGRAYEERGVGEMGAVRDRSTELRDCATDGDL
jgi:deoxyribodipyrimidine photolyase-like uncharacterized protein